MANLDNDEDVKPFIPTPSNSKQTTKNHPTHVIGAVVLFYFVISLSVVFLNKFILSTSEYKFPYPLFVTWFQLVVALVVLLVWSHLGKRYV